MLATAGFLSKSVPLRLLEIIHFTILCHAITIDDGLEFLGKLVCPMKRRWIFWRMQLMHCRQRARNPHRLKHTPHPRQIIPRNPRLGNQRLPIHRIIKHIQRRVDRLLAPHHTVPVLEILGYQAEFRVERRGRGLQDGDDVVESGVAFVELFFAGLGGLGEGEYYCAEGFCYFADFGEDDGAVGKDYEDCFVDCCVGLDVEEGLVDFGCVHLLSITESG